MSTSSHPATTPDVTVSALVSGDLAEVERIERACFPRPWTAATFTAELARDDRRYLVATCAGRGGVAQAGGLVVGFGGVADLAGDAHVMTLAVDPARRGRGHGRVLLAALLTAARDELGVERATLEVRESNAAARSLYRHAGFAEVGVRPGYYAETGEAAVILWCDDLDAAVATLGDAARHDRHEEAR